MSFGQPGLLWWALLLAVPLVIHLLNRRRHRRRPWAAMEFLAAAFRRVRRRVRLENLLLLLLRCALPLLLALAVARPFVGRSSPLAALAEAPRHHVLIVDATLSGSQKAPGHPSPLARARTLADRYLRRLPPGEFQKITLIRLDHSPRVLLEKGPDPGRALELLPELCQPGFGAAGLGRALELAAEVAADREARPLVLVFTDLQKIAFGRDEGETAADPVALALGRLQELMGEPAFLVDTGPPAPPPNATLLSLTLAEPIAVRGLVLEARARIRNHTPEPLADLPVTFELDGERIPAQPVTVPPGGTAEAACRFPILQSGPHWLLASLPADGLEGDDQAWLAVEARDRIRVLAVDGRPDPDPLLSATGYLAGILDPTGEAGEPGSSLFAVETRDAREFRPAAGELESWDLLLLAEPETLGQPVAEAVAAFVRRGGGLLAIPGDRSEPMGWNLRLGEGAGGPLPVRLVEPRGTRRRGNDYVVPVLPDPLAHPLLAEFKGPLSPILAGAPVYRFFRAVPIRPGAEVVLRLSDPEASPLLVADRFGLGRTLFLASPITGDDGRANELNAPLLAFPLFYPALLWLTHDPGRALNLKAGQPLSLRFRQPPREVQVTPPGGRPAPLRGGAVPLPEGDFGWPAWTGMDLPGIYRVDLAFAEGAPPGETPLRYVAANVDPAEGDLARFTEEGLKARLGPAPWRLSRELPEASLAEEGGGGDLGYRLLFAVGVLLLAEGLLAAFLGRGRR